MKKEKRYIGVDPGKTGAIVVLDEDLAVIEWYDMPTIKNDKKKKEVDPYKIGEIMDNFSDFNTTVYLEKVHAMPNQGVSSMFSFGCSFGIIKGVTGACSFPIHLVPPQRWKKHFDLIGSEKKDAAFLSQLMYPDLPIVVENKRYKDGYKYNLGLADAILIARAGQKLFN